ASLLDLAVVSALERSVCVLCRYVLSADVVEKAVESLADDRKRPCVLVSGGSGDRVAHDTDAEGVRDPDRRRQEAGLAHPLQAGQLTVAVEPVTAGDERRLGWHDHRHAGADG